MNLNKCSMIKIKTYVLSMFNMGCAQIAIKHFSPLLYLKTSQYGSYFGWQIRDWLYRHGFWPVSDRKPHARSRPHRQKQLERVDRKDNQRARADQKANPRARGADERSPFNRSQM